MTYRFQSNETIPAAVQRIAAELLDEALEHTNAKIKLDVAVHDTRVCFKKMRGLLRLVRPELVEEEYKRENVFYRDLNRQLSSLRDADALSESLAKLKERFANEL